MIFWAAFYDSLVNIRWLLGNIWWLLGNILRFFGQHRLIESVCSTFSYLTQWCNICESQMVNFGHCLRFVRCGGSSDLPPIKILLCFYICQSDSFLYFSFTCVSPIPSYLLMLHFDGLSSWFSCQSFVLFHSTKLHKCDKLKLFYGVQTLY